MAVDRSSLLERLSREGANRQSLCALLDALAEEIDCERVFLFRLRPGGGFRVLCARNRDRENVPSPAVLMSHYAVQQMAASGEAFFTDDARSDRRYRPEAVLHGKKVPASILVLPLRAQGVLSGGVYADHRFRVLDERAGERCRELVSLVEIALQMRGLKERLSKERRALDVRSAPAIPEESAEPTGSRVERLSRPPSAGDLPAPTRFHGLASANPDFLDVFDTVRALEHSGLSVLIYGETGVGKELLAQAIHASSERRDKPFITVACGSLPEALIESELLGHVKGAFTGAESDREGLFTAAHEGTLFLDDVGEMSPSLQTKLLRVLADGEVRPVGAKSSRKVDVRLVSAAREDLERGVEAGSFRRDLYYRLKGVVLEIPPLRERSEDILPLAEHFLEHHARQASRTPPRLARSARVRLLRHVWLGNVRELENEMRRLVALGVETVSRQHLRLSGRSRGRASGHRGEGRSVNLDEVVHSAEKEAILKVLRRSGGNKSRTAAELGITRKALYRRLAKYGISL
jgi:transcriptional regulator with GAF, ATPase, and Fis domain